MKISFDRQSTVEWIKTFQIDMEKEEVKVKLAEFLDDNPMGTMEQYLAMDKDERYDILQEFVSWIVDNEEDETCFEVTRDECIDCHGSEDTDIELLD